MELIMQPTSETCGKEYTHFQKESCTAPIFYFDHPYERRIYTLGTAVRRKVL